MKKIILINLLLLISTSIFAQKNIDSLIRVKDRDLKGLSKNDYTTSEKTKLAGIATGATANSTDAQLRDRTTHTGVQGISTVSSLQDSLDSKYKVLMNISELQSYTKKNIALFDGSEWIKKSGNKTSNGAGYAGTIIRIDDSNYWERNVRNGIYNIEWWGASTDRQDNEVAINQAINSIAGGTITANIGTYIISAPIQMKRGIMLKGAGTFDDLGNSTKIKLANNKNCSLLTIPYMLGGAKTHYMSIENILFDGNKDNQTSEIEAVVFGGYVGTQMNYVSIQNVFGKALSIKGGADIKLSHIWILNVETSTYAFDTNADLTLGDRDGTMNIDFLFVEKIANIKGGDALGNASQRGNAIRLHRLGSANANELHVEYCSYGISIESCHQINITTAHCSNIGNSNTDAALISIVNGDTKTIKIGNLQLYQSTAKAIMKKIGFTSNLIPDDESTIFVSSYMAGSSEAYPNTIQYSLVSNKLDIKKIGNASRTQLNLFNSTASNSFIKAEGSIFSFGSNMNQSSDKTFLQINTGGNAGDNITFSDPIYLGNRTNASNLGLGALLSYNNYPAYSFGSNRVLYIPTISNAITAPSTTPDYTGQLHINTSSNQLYFAKGVSGSSDWVGITSATNIFNGNITINTGNLQLDNNQSIIAKKANGTQRAILTAGGDNATVHLSLGNGHKFWSENFGLLIASFKENGQVGIGTDSPNSSSSLDITSTTKGVLLPRMTTAQRNAISSSATGLLVYDTDLTRLMSYDGTSWGTVGSLTGSFSTIASSQTAFTVTIGTTMPNNTYKVEMTPTSSVIAGGSCYVSSKTTTQFVLTCNSLTGTASFDWAILR